MILPNYNGQRRNHLSFLYAEGRRQRAKHLAQLFISGKKDTWQK
jgi:hypothetical protein